jgi:hypothetical protein
MGKLNVEDSKGIKPKQKEQARKGQAAAGAAADANAAAVKMTDGNRPIEEVIAKSQGDLIKVRRIINEGGFSGPQKDKYLISLHHAEWIQARNKYIDCDRNIEKKSIAYTALVKGKAQGHEIIKAHNEWDEMKKKCRSSRREAMEKAVQYVETDRRVRENKKKEDSIYTPVQGFQVSREGFMVGEEPVKEGFDFYEEQKIVDNTLIGAVPNQVPRYNVRLPLLSDDNAIRSTVDGKTILPWDQFYVDCSQQNAGQVDICKLAVNKKNEYISGINKNFERANRLLNTYYNVSNKSDSQSKLTLLEEADIKSILENQKKNIALIKQNALYDYEEYNSLAFYEDLVLFLYYALFLMFLFISIREYFSTSSYNYLNIVILILLGTYPRYILIAVLWILNGLTKITDALGLKNVSFWK